MRSTTEVAWWMRLLFALGSLILTLVLAIGSMAVKDFRHEPGLQWFNGGETQMIVFALIAGGMGLLATYIAFVLPVVLLWPAASQRRHWYAVMFVSVLWPPLLYGIILHNEPLSSAIGDFRRYPSIYGWLELIALFSCGLYLVLIRWQHRRLVRRQSL